MTTTTSRSLATAIEERLLPELEVAVDELAPDAGWIIERIVRGRGLEVPLAA